MRDLYLVVSVLFAVGCTEAPLDHEVEKPSPDLADECVSPALGVLHGRAQVRHGGSSGADEGREWFEIYNASGGPIELQGLVLEHGRMVGMLTFHELLRALAARGGSLGELKVAEIMTRSPVTATPDMEVNDLRRTMIESGARYLPVLQDGRLLGVISFRDVAKAVLEEQDFENKMLKGYIKNWPA